MAGRGNPHSKLKYEELVKNSINSSFRRDINDPRLKFVSITKVELSEDYANAKVWWDTFDSSKKESITEAIDHLKGKIRTILASRLDVRHVPELHFVYDSQYEDEQKIDKLLKGESGDKEE
ncbi:MAG: 30S ribosome-binding factor RbfA [Bacteriovoracaceae bacterium]|nr:30S ribosome-binding factor RbfA [Bacteriovoracaceae bacterium]